MAGRVCRGKMFIKYIATDTDLFSSRKLLYILRHRGVQLILAYCWARPAILAAGKGEGGMFLFLLFLTFIHFLSLLSLSSPLLSLLSLFSLSLGDNTRWPTRVDLLLNPNTIKSNEPKSWFFLFHDKHICCWYLLEKSSLKFLGPVVQSIVSLTCSLRVISLTVLADLIHNILIFFAEKMWVAFALQKLLTFLQQKISAYLHITRCKF